MKVKFSDITKYSKGIQIKGDDLIKDGEYLYLNGGINPSGKWNSANVSGDTVTISEGGNSAGYVNYMEKPFWCGAHCYYLFDGPQNTKYLYYALKSQQERLFKIRSGACMPNIKKTDLAKFEFNFDMDEQNQNKVVSVLSRVEDVITRYKKEIEMLDKLIRARFIEMFGNETEFDKWPYCMIGDVADVCVGVVIKPTQYYADKGIPAFRSLNIGEMYVKDSDWIYFTKEGHQKNQKSVVHKNDVLVVRSGAPGTACVATEKYDGYNSVDIIIAHPDNSKVNSTFLAAFTNMPHGMNQIRERTGGAAQQHFNVGGYKTMRLIMPSIELQNQFAAFVAHIDKSKVAVQKALDEAQLLFDSLMQKYFG